MHRPRCKLINPDTALRCGCGYDFESRTVEKAYFRQDLPREIRTYLIIFLVWNAVGALVSLMSGDMVRPLLLVGWMAVVYACYVNLVRKKNWARIALVFLTFPVGLLLLGSEARLYCLQPQG